MRKIVIAGGDSKAEYIINSFRKQKDTQLVVINPSKEVAERLKQACKIDVRHGEPWSRRALEDSDAFDADVFVALCDSDTDNFAACLMAKEILSPSKVICVVDNPNNVEFFEALGVPSVISSTYELGQKIMNEVSINELAKVVANVGTSLEFIEFRVLHEHAICDRFIKDIRFPSYASIAAIVRNGKAIIPNGNIEIKARDKLYIGTEPVNKKKVYDYLQSKRPLSALGAKIAAVGENVRTQRANRKKNEE
ncbi:MAG: NAD-binding protein [Bacilli bacterium]|nr:NAD-binding protein [Bacilli bacterium]